MLEKIKCLLDLKDSSKDELINLLIESSIEEAKEYTNNPRVADSNVICEMVVYRFNRLGTEGVNKESYSGVSFDYSSQYPDSIMRHLKSYRKLRVILND